MQIDTAKVAWNYTNIQEVKRQSISISSWGGLEYSKPVSCVDMFGNEVPISSRRPKLIKLENGEFKPEID